MTGRAAVSEGRGLALVAFSASCFSAIPIAVTIAQRNGLPLLSTLAWRYLLATVVLLALAARTRDAMFTRRAVLPIVILGGMQSLVAAVSLSALSLISAATLSFLFYTYPAWIAVIAAVRGTDRLTGRRIAALAIALAGIAIMVGLPGRGEIHPVGIGLALASALIYALYVPIFGAFDRKHGTTHAATYATAGAAVAFILAGIAAPGFTAGLRLPGNAAAWGAVLFLALVATALAFVTFLRGLAAVGPVRAGIVSTVEPFVTATLAALVLGQPLTAATLAGGLCVAAAVILLQRAGSALPNERSPDPSDPELT